MKGDMKGGANRMRVCDHVTDPVDNGWRLGLSSENFEKLTFSVKLPDTYDGKLGTIFSDWGADIIVRAHGRGRIVVSEFLKEVAPRLPCRPVEQDFRWQHL